MSASIYFDDEHQMLRETIRRFIREEVAPEADGWEREGRVPRSIIERMGALGLLGLTHPEEHGGGGLDRRATVLLAEELGRSTYGGFAITVLVHTEMASPHLARFGSDAQRRRYLPGVIAGNLLTAIAVTEPDVGSDVAAIQARALPDGDGFRLSGSKMFITNGVHADLYIVAARTNPEVKPSRGITLFLIERGTPGLEVSRSLDKMGWHSSDTAELSLQDCRVPASCVLGEVDRGFYAIMRNFQTERLAMAAMAIGECGAAIELTLRYVTTRQAFGGSLLQQQTIRQRLAMLDARVEAGRQLVHHAAWLDAQGHDAVREVSMAKAYCGELVNEVMYHCLQFHGGFGYMREATIERMTRDARVHSIGGGATEVMLEEVAKRFPID
ncbi:MAG: acyl-CoA dehydrogenase family protein [Gemmatimonadales bacterium]